MSRPNYSSVIAAGISLALQLGTGCTNDVAGPQTGAAQVTIATAGADLDPDGYVVLVDSGTPLAIPINGNATIVGLKVGNHTVALTGIAANCALNGANPRSIIVAAGDTARVGFSIECVGNAATLVVKVSTTGTDLDPDGYSVRVDAGVGQPVAINGAVTISRLYTGNYFVSLDGVATNCTASPESPVVVTVYSGVTTELSFSVTCVGISSAVSQLAFVSSSNNSYNIYLMNSDGSGVVRLTTFPAYQPAWSADGTKIAFSNTRCCGSIYTMNADGTGLVRLTNTFTDDAPAWSPDGTKIAFERFLGNGETEIYVIHPDGSGVTQLTSTPNGVNGHPTWSPDGSRIAFESHRDGHFHIYVMNADGSGVVRLTNDPTHSDLNPVWSPDGTRIAFVRDGHLYVMNADGSSQTNLNAVSDPNEGGLSWSPDGAKIAVGVGTCDDSGCSIDIWVVNVDGTNLAALTNDHTSLQPAWRPRIP